MCYGYPHKGEDSAVLVSSAEMEAELTQDVTNTKHKDPQHSSGREWMPKGKRLPKAGKYPTGYSPFRLHDKHISLKPRAVKADLAQLRLELSNHFSSRYFSEDTSVYACEQEQVHQFSTSVMAGSGLQSLAIKEKIRTTNPSSPRSRTGKVFAAAAGEERNREVAKTLTTPGKSSGGATTTTSRKRAWHIARPTSRTQETAQLMKALAASLQEAKQLQV
jgi:hypothetical protein